MGLNVVGYQSHLGQLGRPGCGHERSSHPSPVLALLLYYYCMRFYSDAGSAFLQLVKQWLNFTYSRSCAVLVSSCDPIPPSTPHTSKHNETKKHKGLQNGPRQLLGHDGRRETRHPRPPGRTRRIQVIPWSPSLSTQVSFVAASVGFPGTS